ncbi:gluconokinase, GntK/IdnK-type [Streptomyces sp. NBC_01351]|uniref:gluconokinase, GntK/IdnK-type n=1 Tax=Streptomyces sp. NBC_01351 TaxID=2903833 RepID=UPI003FCD4845
MDESSELTERFLEHRSHLRAVAYRMLGSLSEAEDAVQEAWLRLDRSDTSEVENLGGWLTTVVARVCLNMLRSRETRREESIEAYATDPAAGREDGVDPEQEAVLADSVGLALLVVLDKLAPAERLAFVLHDMFSVSFDEIAPMLDKTPAATRQLASRARRRVKGVPLVPDADLTRQRVVVDAFLAATRGGNFDALVTLLHPDVVLTADKAVIPSPAAITISGAVTVATGAMAAMQRAQGTQSALVNGMVGLAMAPLGQLVLVLRFTVEDDLITAIDVVAEPERLGELDIAVLDDVRRVIVVMGVAGTGKTTVGRLLAEALGVPYAEGDAFHPAANVAKMSAGTPLDDADRWPWLDSIGEWIRDSARLHGGVVAASSLKRVYRDRLRAAAPGTVFVHLTGERPLVEERMAARRSHFMPPTLLDSQFATLEPLGADELGVVVDVSASPEDITGAALTALGQLRTTED